MTQESPFCKNYRNITFLLSGRYKRNFLDAKTLCLAQNRCIMPTKALLILMSVKLKIKRAKRCLKMNARVT